MLVWATELPMRSGSTAKDILDIAHKWLNGSPHSNWTGSNIIPKPSSGELLTASIKDETVYSAYVERDTESWGGFRYIRLESDSSEWTTEIVAYQRPAGLLASVQLHCELQGAAPVTPKPKKPYIVKQLLADIGGGNDGGIPIGDTPLFIKEADVTLAERIITGKLNNHLPIIYASSTWQDVPSINVQRLAQWASGIAHVIVEPSRIFSFILARNTGGQNVYGGAIGIYWPKNQGMRAVLKPENYASPVRLASATADLVRRALLNCRPTKKCSWDYVTELVSGQRLEKLRASGSRELKDFIEAFDNDIQAKNQHIEKLERESTRLRVELQRAEGIAEVSRGGLLRPGKESPFYTGELRDAIIKALNAGKGQLLADGRCSHIIDDVLHANPKSKEESEISEEIRDILTKCESLGKEQQKALEQLGFTFNFSGKHIEATYHDDPRYTFTMAKTGSDWRGMKNQASDIIKKLFK